MELKINQLVNPEPIQFNYIEIKKWLSDGAEKYKTIVYTDDNIAQAKTDRADLNRLKKSLNDRRIQIEKEFTKPVREFKEKIDELIKLIDEPAKIIDAQVKDYEQRKRDEKSAQIAEYFDGIEDKPEWLQAGQIWDQKWLNASKSMKSIREEIQIAVETVKKDLATLSEIEDFGFEATEVYKTTLDINKALAEGIRLSEIQKRKAAEAARKAEEERQRMEAAVQPQPQTWENAAQPEPYWQPEEPAQVVKDAQQMEFPVWVNFSVLVTTPQAQALATFCRQQGIQIRKI